MKVLLSGNNPIIQFYTSRFQENKNIELFHVSSKKSNFFQIDTLKYGQANYNLDNHFTSIPHLVEALDQLSPSISFTFDIIILSVASLRELSSIPNDLQSIIDSNTTILIESTGFLQLDQFIKASNVLTKNNVFSILANYDIREIDSNKYKQFIHNNNNGSSEEKIYIGQFTNGSKSSQQQKNSNFINSKYSTGVVDTLKFLVTTFEESFKRDEISTCNYSPSSFLSKQWSMAIPKVCLDPLLILFEETDVNQFPQQILAKPLISGLITELLTVAKSMNAKLNDKMDNENHILKNWKSTYSNNNDFPPILYHFINNIPCLDIDVLLLQPILLADDYGIKTPYLEFLYTIITQYDRINNDESNWFIRKEQISKLRENFNSLANENENLTNNINNLSSTHQNMDSKIQNLLSQINTLQNENKQLKQNHSLQLNEKESSINALLKQIESLKLSQDNSSGAGAAQFPQPPQIKENNTRSLESMEGDKPEVFQDASDVDTSFDDREQKLFQREAELREKEQEFQRKLSLQQQQMNQQQQQQQQQQQHQPLQQAPQLQNQYMKNMNLSNGSAQNISPIYTQQHGSTKQFVPNNRSNHSTPTLGMSPSNFVDPISSGLSPTMDSLSSFGPNHPIKPTSRKNRKSNMPNLGNASSVGYNDLNQPAMGGGRRVASLPMHQMSSDMNGNKSRQGLGLDMPQPNRNKQFPVMDNTNNLNANTNTNLSNANMTIGVSTPKNATKPIQFNSAANIYNDNTTENRQPLSNRGPVMQSTPQMSQPIDSSTATSSPMIANKEFNSDNGNPTHENNTLLNPMTNNVATPPIVTEKQDNGDNNDNNKKENSNKKKKKKFGLFGKKNKD